MHIDEIFDYVKSQQDDLDAVNRFIKLKAMEQPVGAMSPSLEALLITGIDPAKSRATRILYLVEQYFKLCSDTAQTLKGN